MYYEFRSVHASICLFVHLSLCLSDHLSVGNAKRGQKVRNWVFYDSKKTLSVHLYFFLLQYESTKGLLTFCKNHITGKIWHWSNSQESFRPIRMHGSLNCNITKTKSDMKLNFCM